MSQEQQLPNSQFEAVTASRNGASSYTLILNTAANYCLILGLTEVILVKLSCVFLLVSCIVLQSFELFIIKIRNAIKNLLRLQKIHFYAYMHDEFLTFLLEKGQKLTLS